MDPSITKNFLKVLYAGNMLWHSSAFIHFSFRQPLMMRKLTVRRHSKNPTVSSSPEGDPWHHDIMAYLGYINVPYALLAGQRLYKLVFFDSSEDAETEKALELMALTVLCLANASQAYGNFVRSRGSGRWIMGRGFDRVTVLDAVFTVLDALAVWKLGRQ